MQTSGQNIQLLYRLGLVLRLGSVWLVVTLRTFNIRHCTECHRPPEDAVGG